MSTRLENYLRGNRSMLDVEYPDDNKIWSGIKKGRVSAEGERNLQYRKSGNYRNFWKIAALVTLVLSLSYITADIIDGRSRSVGNASLSTLDSELGRIENEYIQRVTLKQKEMQAYRQTDNNIVTSLLKELNQQDELYKESVKDIEELGNNDQVINTIFNIYERKIELLERIIIEINKSENYEKDNEVSL